MSIKIVVRSDLRLGVWQGMGGAITEATAYNFSKLSAEKQAGLLNAYYGANGLDYRWGRICIGSNDFCLEPYEYTRKNNLEDFSVERDEQYVLPLLRRILEKKELKLLASPWSPPSNMKTTRKMRYGGRLRFWQYRNYAHYLRKWIDEYGDRGVRIDYLSPQNEPFAKQIWESCLYSFRAQRRIIHRYLINELSGTDVKILVWDHNKSKLAKVADELLRNNAHGQEECVAGICYHWYDGTYPNEMWKVRQKYPETLMVSSEMCCAFSPYDAAEWEGAARLYLGELMQDINSGTNAWIDWNMLLSWGGGPSYCENYVKSPVILNKSGDDYILTPIFDALRRFAKAFPAGSEVVRCELESDKIVAVGRKAKGGYIVVLANVSGEVQQADVRCDGETRKVELACGEIKSIRF